MLNFSDFLIKKNRFKKKKIFKGRNLSYSKLYYLVDKISKNLFFDLKNQLIGLSLDNSEEFLILYLSIIKSGNIAVLFERALPNNRQSELLRKFKLLSRLAVKK